MISLSLKQVCVRVGLVAMLLGAFSLPLVWAQSVPPPPSDPELMLKPLVDNRQYDTEPQPSNLLEGNVLRRMEPASLVPNNGSFQSVGTSGSASPSGTTVLTGQVQTLQQAIVSENSVDWYAWYLSARDYLGRMGGLQCPLGTPIKFYRNGRIEALTFNPLCQASVAGRVFPLPQKTHLEAVVLPVRPGEGPPASRDEIYSRVNGTGFR